MADARIIVSRVAAVTAAVRRGLDKGVRAVAFEVQGLAMDEMLAYPEKQRPIDTGALRASGYVEAGDSGDRERALSEASRAASSPGQKSGRPGRAKFSPDVDPVGELEAATVFGQEYATFIETGTDKRPATPFLGPARDVVQPIADGIVARFIDDELRRQP